MVLAVNIVVFLCIFQVSVHSLPFGSDSDGQWEKFKQDFGKEYGASEEKARRLTFEDNLRYIEEHNTNGNHSFTLGLNEYADMTSDEFVAFMNGLREQGANGGVCHLYVNDASVSHLPDTVDWRKDGYVTEVKNQMVLAVNIVVFLCIFQVSVHCLPFGSDSDGQWEKFKQDFGKEYGASEEKARRLTFEDNLRYIEEHNTHGNHSFTLGLNEYADMTSDEFVAFMNGLREQGANGGVCHLYVNDASVSDLPDTVDWRKEGYVTEVKNQGQCGSCWAFSVTGSLEGQNFKKNGKLVSLSEKNLMDCSKREGNKGCDGGLMDLGFEYVIKNQGIDTEVSYPYEPKDGKCNFDKTNIGATEESCKDIWKGSENELQKAVATEGPISVGIDASLRSFQLYKSGVYYDELCSTRHLDHGVLAVGYGNEGGQDYWLVKNSWGTTWGQEGYILMTRNKHNSCGIASQASFPTM